mmetsp:Transcript_56647/g.77226  ORF Transcript_56647/g.77226 Transcript_56647/m.77226 type:complete len:215 (+) Transcript_56647:278-922(+)
MNFSQIRQPLSASSAPRRFTSARRPSQSSPPRSLFLGQIRVLIFVFGDRLLLRDRLSLLLHVRLFSVCRSLGRALLLLNRFSLSGYSFFILHLRHLVLQLFHLQSLCTLCHLGINFALTISSNCPVLCVRLCRCRLHLVAPAVLLLNDVGLHGCNSCIKFFPHGFHRCIGICMFDLRSGSFSPSLFNQLCEPNNLTFPILINALLDHSVFVTLF